MTNAKTIYDQYKENWDLLAAIGKPNVGEAAKHFFTFSDMERAIGYTSSTVKKWAEGHNSVSSRSDGMAAHWLKAGHTPADAESTNMLLVITPRASADKVRRVLAMMGCEFEDV